MKIRRIVRTTLMGIGIFIIIFTLINVGFDKFEDAIEEEYELISDDPFALEVYRNKDSGFCYLKEGLRLTPMDCREGKNE